MLFSVVLAVILLLAGESQGQDVVRAIVGQSVTFECDTTNTFYYKTVGWYMWDEDQIYEYKDGGYLLIRPDKYAASWDSTNRYHYLTIKEVAFEDDGNYTCRTTDPNYSTEYTVILEVETYKLSNMVARFNSRDVNLLYAAEIEGGASIQWMHTNIANDSEMTTSHIYYAKSDGGGVLPEFQDQFRPTVFGNGIALISLDAQTTGKYKYFLVDAPFVEQKEISVTATGQLECSAPNYLVEKDWNHQSCSAVVSPGDLVPEFTWLKNGEEVEGYLEQLDDVDPNGILWNYNHSFAAELDDIKAVFTCKITFKYDGEPSKYEDTSNPGYTDSCEIRYSRIEFPVRDVTITTNSSLTNPLIMRVGQRLTCSADGSPEAAYEWKCDGFDRVYGRYFVIEKDTVGRKEINCVCVASNILSDGYLYNASASVEFRSTHASGIIYTPESQIMELTEHSVTQLVCRAVNFGDETASWDIQWAAHFDNGEDTTYILYHSVGRNGSIVEEWSNDFEEAHDQHDLTIKVTRFDIAGTYYCQEMSYPDSDTWEAELVIRSPVRCFGPKKVKRDQYVEITCEAEYGGFIEPMLSWNNLEEDSQEMYITEGGAPRTISSAVNVTAGSYVCELTFGLSSEIDASDQCRIDVELDEEDGEDGVEVRDDYLD